VQVAFVGAIPAAAEWQLAQLTVPCWSCRNGSSRRRVASGATRIVVATRCRVPISPGA
jgi:hypothetical protein